MKKDGALILYSKKAQEIIWKLINDKDDIIRVTAFDKIENILDIDTILGKNILEHIIKNNRHPKLVERAKTLMRRYE